MKVEYDVDGNIQSKSKRRAFCRWNKKEAYAQPVPDTSKWWIWTIYYYYYITLKVFGGDWFHVHKCDHSWSSCNPPWTHITFYYIYILNLENELQLVKKEIDFDVIPINAHDIRLCRQLVRMEVHGEYRRYIIITHESRIRCGWKYPIKVEKARFLPLK